MCGWRVSVAAVVGLDVPVRVVVILRDISFGFWQASDIPPAASSFDRQGITEHLTRLKLPPVSRVYCSPIMRCAQTAAAAASELGISELRVDPSLSETICEDWYVAFCHGHVRVLQPISCRMCSAYFVLLAHLRHPPSLVANLPAPPGTVLGAFLGLIRAGVGRKGCVQARLLTLRRYTPAAKGE